MKGRLFALALGCLPAMACRKVERRGDVASDPTPSTSIVASTSAVVDDPPFADLRCVEGVIGGDGSKAPAFRTMRGMIGDVSATSREIAAWLAPELCADFQAFARCKDRADRFPVVRDAGELVLSITIASTGLVVGLAGGTIVDHGFDACVVENLSATVVPPGVSPGHARYTLSIRALVDVHLGMLSFPGPGELDMGAVETTIGAHTPAMRDCFLEGLARDVTIRGSVDVKFSVDAHGAVIGAKRAGGDLADPIVGACVLRVYETMKFPPPRLGTPPVESLVDLELL